MPLFDFFKKSKAVPSLPQLCYDIAYFILPIYAYQRLDGLREITAREKIGGPFFYIMACQQHKIEPDPDVAQGFQWHSGAFSDGSTHLTLEYPTPPPVSRNLNQMVLAPYFSSVVETKDRGVHYFILGQSPMGGTTLRTVTPDGANANLGPGTEPALDAFLARISPDKGEDFEVVAAVGPSR